MDHLNLTYFTTTKALNLQQARWSEKLGGYNFRIIYKPGRTNSKADLLLQQEDYMAEGQKEYKKLRPPLLPVKRWVGLSKRDSSKAIPKKTMPGEVSCPCACGRGRCNDDKNNHVVGGLVVYQGGVQWCCYTTPACDCKIKVVLSSNCIERFTLEL